MPRSIKMTRQVSGTRNGQAWPAAGGSVELPDGEADTLVSLGMAEDVKAPVKVAPEERPNTRTAEPTRRATKNPRKSKG